MGVYQEGKEGHSKNGTCNCQTNEKQLGVFRNYKFKRIQHLKGASSVAGTLLGTGNPVAKANLVSAVITLIF